jgi:hypothetical protein
MTKMTELEKVDKLLDKLMDEMGWLKLEQVLNSSADCKLKVLESEIFQLQFDRKLLIRDDVSTSLNIH